MNIKTLQSSSDFIRGAEVCELPNQVLPQSRVAFDFHAGTLASFSLPNGILLGSGGVVPPGCSAIAVNLTRNGARTDTKYTGDVLLTVTVTVESVNPVTVAPAQMLEFLSCFHTIAC